MKPYFICTRRLEEARLFESKEHEDRFTELISCYSSYPFFGKGLCKVMYLGSWDEEHFIQLLSILNDLILDHCQTTTGMKDNSKALEAEANGYDKYIIQLSNCFLNDESFPMPEEEIERKGMYIITQALQAAQVIEDFFEE